jgi:hypothetical protein
MEIKESASGPDYMEETHHYTDLLKAHKLFREIEGRWRFYDAYMQAREPNIWFRSPDVPLKEGLLLFGFIQSWDPYFRGELATFLQTYRDIFEMISEFKNETIIGINLTNRVQNTVAIIFDRIAYSTRERRFESTDTSKILHVIIPELFVMWEDKVRKEIVGEGRDGRCYAFEFLPKMHRLAHEFVDGYVEEKGGSCESASREISSMADNYTLAKLIDELNFVRYRKKKSVQEIRSVQL